MDEKLDKFEDWYVNMKIYNNGEHNVGIPHSKKKGKKRYKKVEKEYFVHEREGKIVAVKKPTLELLDDDIEEELECPFTEEEMQPKQTKSNKETPSKEGVRQHTRKVTRSDEFERLYNDSNDMTSKKRESYIIGNMLSFFENDSAAKHFVRKKLEDKKRAGVQRAKRFRRKANNIKFDYFATFTYDDKKLTEEKFEKKFLYCLQRLGNRQGWKYLGVWERGKATNRLHFHALLKVPEGAMPGEFKILKDYNFKEHDSREVVQNSFFLQKFGRNEFSKLSSQKIEYSRTLTYLLKYISKTDVKIVSSRGIPMYYEVTVPGSDVICKTGKENKKVVLKDDFACFNEEGEYLGAFGEDTKARLPHKSS